MAQRSSMKPPTTLLCVFYYLFTTEFDPAAAGYFWRRHKGSQKLTPFRLGSAEPNVPERSASGKRGPPVNLAQLDSSLERISSKKYHIAPQEYEKLLLGGIEDRYTTSVSALITFILIVRHKLGCHHRVTACFLLT